MDVVEQGEQTIIILSPGEEITVRAMAAAAPGPASPIDDGEGMRVLPVPWVGQWGPTANRSSGDCGPACLASVVRFLTDHRDVTVDEVAVACGQPAGSRWADFVQLGRGARHYGLVPHYRRPLGWGEIVAEIEAGCPVLALIKYNVLPGNQDSYAGAHFVLVVGYSEDGVIFHDPDRLSGDEFGEFREVERSAFLEALGSTSKTPGNTFDNQGLLFEV